MLIYILSRFSSSYSTARLKEAAEKQGHTTRIIDHTKCELLLTKQKSISYKGKRLAIPDFIIPRVGASSTFQGVNVIRQYESMKVPTTTSSVGLVNSRDKLNALQILGANGVPIPDTYFSTGVYNWKSIVNTVGTPPFIVKLLEGTQGLGVYLATNKQLAKELIESHLTINKPFLVQRYIKESAGTDIRVFVLGGKVIASMKRTGPPGEFRSNIHRGGTGEQIKLTVEEEKVAIQSVKCLGLLVGGVDLLRSNIGPLVLEVNSSPGLEGIEKYTGIDVASSILKTITNNGN